MTNMEALRSVNRMHRKSIIKFAVGTIGFILGLDTILNEMYAFGKEDLAKNIIEFDIGSEKESKE